MNTGGKGTSYSGAVCGWVLEEQRPITQWRSLDIFWECRDNLDFGGVEWICEVQKSVYEYWRCKDQILRN